MFEGFVLGVTTLSLYLGLVGAGQAFAGGFIIPHQTARGLGLSNALTAGIDDPSAVYYNPAALGEVQGDQVLVGGTYINVVNSVENSGRRAVNKHDDNFLASLFANYHIPRTDLTVGVGTYTPFGLATSYETEFTRFAALRSELKTLYVTPAISWHPSKLFSLGAGFSFVHSSAILSRSLCFAPPGVPDPVTGATGCLTPGGLFEGKVRITDSGDAFSYNLGVLVKPHENLKLGFSYRGRADLRFDHATGKFGGAFDSSTVRAKIRPVSLPPVVNVGLFWQINPAWGLEFVYEHVRWSEFQKVAATFSPAPIFLPFGVPVTSFNLPQEWTNTSVLRLGSFYRLYENLELRAGLGLDETPIPAKRLNPTIPGADILSLNAGLGYRWDKWMMDVAYMAVFYKNRRVSNLELEGIPATPFPHTGAPGRDKYETFNNFVSLTLGYRF
ncbi:MAG: outer membrane protein transport protein [Deltaproteobacteria bacterium]|nr:outer membrane protein transport protein [Deltaproteobacteria bacterium]